MSDVPQDREWLDDRDVALFVGGLVGIPAVAALASYLTPLPFGAIALPLFVWWTVVVPLRLVRAARATDVDPARTRTGFRPVRFGWLAMWAIAIVVVVPLLIVVLLL